MFTAPHSVGSYNISRVVNPPSWPKRPDDQAALHYLSCMMPVKEDKQGEQKNEQATPCNSRLCSTVDDSSG